MCRQQKALYRKQRLACAHIAHCKPHHVCKHLLTTHRRATAQLTADKYVEMFAENDGTVPATFQVSLVAIPGARALVGPSAAMCPASAAPIDVCIQGSHVPNREALDCTLQVIYLTGWAPHSSQQSAARRGSASASLQVGATRLQGGFLACQCGNRTVVAL